MKTLLCFFTFWLGAFLAANAHAHFNAKGHVHRLEETKRVFLNPDCRSTGTCDLKRFTLTTWDYEVWFSDDPNNPTYGTGAIMEYETDSVDALAKYAIVQFMKGCVFHSSKTAKGPIDWDVIDTIRSFGESIPYCFPQWVIDSQDSDPAYNSDPDYGRIYLARWNKPGSYDRRTQKYYGAEKPKIPVVYMTDHPSGAFVTGRGVKNSALEFKTCIYKADDVPTHTRRDELQFATPLSCFDWQNVYIYDFATAKFQTDLAAMPKREEPTERVASRGDPRLLSLLVVLGLASLTLLVFRKVRQRNRSSDS
jgi:hypothetical protein